MKFFHRFKRKFLQLINKILDIKASDFTSCLLVVFIILGLLIMTTIIGASGLLDGVDLFPNRDMIPGF